jgi:hypothetical protein
MCNPILQLRHRPILSHSAFIRLSAASRPKSKGRASSRISAVLLITSPTLLTLAWHMRQGRTIECRGQPVLVPTRWIATIDGGNNATLAKFPLVMRSARAA